MADLTVTEANVTSNNTTQTYRSYQAGEALLAGQVVRIDGATGKIIKSQADTEDNADILGITMTAAGLDEYVIIAESGSFITGSTMVAGTYYVVSNTAGSMCPFTDLTTGQYATYAIYATTTTAATIRRLETGVAVA